MKNSYLKQNFHKNTIDTFPDYLGIQNKFTRYNTYYIKAFSQHFAQMRPLWQDFDFGCLVD